MLIALVAGMSSIINPATWARLEAKLTAMRAGDLITVDQVVADTGMRAESAELVLEALVRADLFERHDQQFIRVSLSDDAEWHRAVRRRHG